MRVLGPGREVNSLAALIIAYRRRLDLTEMMSARTKEAESG
jgi:hypothetical protein